MKILDTLRSKETEEKVADLRVKLLFVFVAGIGVTIITWLFRRLCTIRVGLCWYQVWSVLYHAGRLVATLALIGIVLAWVYLLVYSLWDNFSTKGSAIVFYKRPHNNDSSDESAEPGDPNWSPDLGDLSDFD